MKRSLFVFHLLELKCPLAIHISTGMIFEKNIYFFHLKRSCLKDKVQEALMSQWLLALIIFEVHNKKG